ncbi:MAG: hypothetical protein E6Q69_17290 [Aquipseudomonas alcaligenes]|uniref:Lactate dehydrogenase n=1 Tax=Aquipseudomonas alcaligenes TaxID=43263 RepID=A0A5C7VS95_AQUAC|nr:MAG: hypothetical protein E6Q69_17290 [Pseudomonas alcaligenes]
MREVDFINAYLVAGANVVVEAETNPVSTISPMTNGNKPVDGGHLIFSLSEAEAIRSSDVLAAQFVRPFVGSDEAINGKQRFCLWIDDSSIDLAQSIPVISNRMENVRAMRQVSTKELTRRGADAPHAFQQIRQKGDETLIVVPRVSSENRPYLPVALLSHGTIIGDRNFALYDAPLWNMALIASRLHWVWIGTVCVRMRTDFSYSNTLGWNTFPVPTLTAKNKADLTRCAEDILLAREAHFPDTIADLYDPETMPENLRVAHERNDEVLERIYIGRCFKNDTERLEKLFELYTQMATEVAKRGAEKKGTPRRKA